jgi:polyhydroxyalkanoate synthesis regulator phasin
MEKFWRQAWHLGLGLLDFTKEKVENLVEEMIRRGELSHQERGQAVTEILEKAQQEQAAFREKVKTLIQQVITQMGLARAADLEALEQRVAALEAEIQTVFRER